MVDEDPGNAKEISAGLENLKLLREKAAALEKKDEIGE